MMPWKMLREVSRGSLRIRPSGIGSWIAEFPLASIHRIREFPTGNLHLRQQHWHLNCRISFRKLSPDYGILYRKLAHSAVNLHIRPHGRIAHLVEQHWHLNCRISFRKLSPDYGILYRKLAHSAVNLHIRPRCGISYGKLFWPSEFPVHWQHWLLNYRISFTKLSLDYRIS